MLAGAASYIVAAPPKKPKFCVVGHPTKKAEVLPSRQRESCARGIDQAVDLAVQQQAERLAGDDGVNARAFPLDQMTPDSQRRIFDEKLHPAVAAGARTGVRPIAMRKPDRAVADGHHDHSGTDRSRRSLRSAGGTGSAV